MRTPLVWTLRVTISPWNSWPDFLNVPMLAMSLLLCCSSPATIAASMAICGPEAIDDAPPLRAGAQRRMAAVGLSWLARGMGEAQGKKVHRRRCGPGDRGAAVLWPDQAIGGRVACAGPTALEDVADIVSPAQEATVVGRKKRNPGEVMGGHSIPGPGGPAATGRIERAGEHPSRQSKRCNGRAVVMRRRSENARQPAIIEMAAQPSAMPGH